MTLQSISYLSIVEMVSNRIKWQTRVPVELQNWVSNRLVSAHLRIVRPMVLGHLLNLAVLVTSLYGHVATKPLAAFSLLILIGCALRLYIAQGIARGNQRADPTKMVFLIELSSGLLAVSIGAMLAYFLPIVSADIRTLLIVSGTTQIAAASYTIRTMPRAALLYIAQLTLCLLYGIAETGLVGVGMLIVAFAILVGQMVLTSHKAFVDRILRERELSASVNTVRMLLNDFESQGSDWLFELDATGHMHSVSARFAAAANAKAEDMNGRAFAALFANDAARIELEDHLKTGTACRGLPLMLDSISADSARWWSVSLRPVLASSESYVRFRGVISDISQEMQTESRVHRMAHYDSLTGLPNRLMFNNSLTDMIDRRDAETRVALLLIDFDNFKTINDMYGHPVGDAFLKHAGTIMVDCLEESGLGGEGRLVARLGGDEFAIIIHGEDAVDHSVRLADALVEKFAGHLTVAGHELASGISVGIALLPEHASSADALFSFADIALYAAKEDGRGRWEMFQPGMDEALHSRHALARDLRNAVGNGELRLFLQPLVNVETSKHCGFEALMRWEHPERGMVMPDDFIPIAEETGLIVPMGEWMIRTALAEAARWDEPHSIAINLSPVQLRNPNLLPTIVNALATTGIDPARVEMEITESVLLNNSAENITMLNRLHALGIKIALDDFGTGYASLNYLLTFPFDKIKIDRSFVTDLESREESRAIVGAVISLANQLGMCTLAEGVEHEAQLIKLREQGCEMVQGWLFGKAMPVGHYALIKPTEGSRKVA